MKQKADVSYSIELTFGSEWQRELHEPMFDGVIQVIVDRMREKHRHNVAVVKKKINTLPITS